MTLTAGIMIAMGVLSIVNGWILFVAGRLGGKLLKLDEKINDHREDALQNRLDQEKRYATREEMSHKFDQINERLVRIEEAIGKIAPAS